MKYNPSMGSWKVLQKLKGVSDWLGVSNSFALANIFAFATSGSSLGVMLAIVTALLSWRAGLYATGKLSATPELRFFSAANKKLLGPEGRSENLALRINALGTAIAALSTGFVTIFAGGFDTALFPVLAGLSFAVGNYLGSSSNVTLIQKGERDASNITRALTNPAVHYGIGYTNLGLLAGGGLTLFVHPFANIPALVTTMLSIVITFTSIGGLLTDKIKNPAPFMFVAHGTALNVLSAVFTGNILSVLNNMCACHGEVKLGLLLREKDASENKELINKEELKVSVLADLRTLSSLQQSAGFVDQYYRGISHAACWPVRAIDRHKRL